VGSRLAIPLTLATLAAVPAMAHPKWQVGIGLQSIDEARATGSFLTQRLELKRKSDKAALSLFAGYEVLDFGTSGLSVTGEYQFKTANDLELRLGTATHRTDYQRSTFAPGVHWTYRGTVNLGAGLQYRLTRLHLPPDYGNAVSTSNNRLWLTGTADYAFRPHEALQPFVGVRLAAALSRSRMPSTFPVILAPSVAIPDESLRQVMKGMDARAEFAFQAGVRF
jgi:hypothetical protein